MIKTGIYQQLAPVLFGCGTIEQAGEIASNLNMSTVLLVTEKNLAEMGYAAKLTDILKPSGIQVVLWDGVKIDTPDDTILEASAIAREQKADGIVGIGGGSTLDSAKAIAAVAANGDDVLKEIPLYLMGQKQYGQKPLPLILIPTTSGTGSESTFVSVITSAEMDCKIGLPCPPDYAVVDPELTLTVPVQITAYTGMDAFSHANEALTEKKCNPHTELLAYESIRLINEWLPAAVQDGSNLEAREHLALASNFAGIAFNESGVHMGHSTAHALGHKFHIPHGICCALVTPAVIEIAAKIHPDKIKKIGKVMGLEIISTEPGQIGTQVADSIRELLKRIGIPSLKEQGFEKEQILGLKPLIFGEPLCMNFDGELSEADIDALLSTMYEKY